jgi:hypothetical protein
MAITIKTIPTLKGESAVDFEKRAENKSKKRATIDFSKQARIAMAILEKSKSY